MSATKIDADELEQILSLTPNQQNVMLVGRHGIGKSQIITRHFEARGMKVIPFFLGQMSDPGDLIGLMHKDEISGCSVFLPPYWWPEHDEPVVLFLDELNRARPEILQSVMDLALSKRLAGRVLPEGSVVISAVNEGDEYQLTELDPALVSRFNLYEFAPTVEDWLLWATESKIDPRIIDFIQKEPGSLDADPKSDSARTAQPFGGDLTKSPDRRAWEKVSELIQPLPQLSDLHAKLIAGVIGAPVALRFVRAQAQVAAVSADDVLFRFGSNRDALKKLPVPEQIVLNDQLLLRLQTGAPGFSAKDRKMVVDNFVKFLDLMREERQNESIAHLAHQLDHPRYETANAMLFTEPKVLEILTDFVEAIAVE
ncbi:MAG: AAA family ATPase [Verrucomicrobiota bacterium]